MKRIYGIVTGVAAVAAVAYLGNNLWAQPGAQPANYQPGVGAATATYQPPQGGAVPRVAVINMFVVLKNYQKWDTYRKELQATAKEYEERDSRWKAAIASETNKLKNPQLSPKERDDAQNNIKKYTRDMEDNAMIAQKVVGEKGEMQVVQMYKEVEEAVKSFAVSNGYHLVMSYTDLTDPPDQYSARNVTRKLFNSGQSGAACPIYMAPGLDISQQVVTMLNSRYPQAAASGPAPAGPGGMAPTPGQALPRQ